MIQINRTNVFNLEDAQALLPVLKRITFEAKAQTMGLLESLEKSKNEDASEVAIIEDQINAVIEKWQEKVEKLGAKVGGLWIVDFDNGQGYYCWKHTEGQIEFCHGYNEGYTHRRLVVPQTATKEQSIDSFI